jgi:hypothetical protein
MSKTRRICFMKKNGDKNSRDTVPPSASTSEIKEKPPTEERVCTRTAIGNYLLIFESCIRWCGNFKDLSHEREWAKSAENLGASPFQEGLSTDATICPIHLAEQSFNQLQTLV